MKVSEVMTRSVATVSPDHTAREAASFMLSNDAGSIPVTDGERRRKDFLAIDRSPEGAQNETAPEIAAAMARYPF